jgi:hypothetical protein
MQQWMRWVAVVALLAVPQLAHAISGTANEIAVVDGSVSFANNPIRVNEGGTGAATLTDRAVIIGRGTAVVEFASPGANPQPLLSTGAATNPAFGALDLDGTSTVTNELDITFGGTNAASFTGNTCVRVNAGATALESAAGDCSTPTPSIIGFSTNMNLSQGGTIFFAPGVSDTSESRAQTIAPTTVTFDNLNCIATAAPGAADTYTITMADGACTGALTNSTGQVCTIGPSAATRNCAEAGAGEAVTGGECFAYEVVSSGGATADVVISCTHEITG